MPTDHRKLPLPHALFTTLITALMAVPLLGLQLKQDGTSLVVVVESATTWWLIGMGCLGVFAFQMLRPMLPAVHVPAYLPHTFKRIIPSQTSNRQKNAGLLALLLIALIWPLFASRGAVDLATLVLIYIMLGLGLNIVVGLAGLLDLGYVAFYAVGAYSYALLSQYVGLSFWQALPLAGLLAALFGLILGFPVLRLRGDYLAIVTLGFGEIIRILLNNATALTGGPNGIGSIAKPTLFGMEFNREPSAPGVPLFHDVFGIAYDGTHKVIFLYMLAFALVLVTLFVIQRLMRMPIGRAWEALREDEIACRSLGLNRTAIKLSAFILGASFAGFAGCFFAARQGFISPESFTFIESVIILVIVVLGGMGSQLGVILAAIVMILLPELAREFEQYRMMLFGLMMVLMMIWRPEGLVPMRRPEMGIASD